ncbi:MAG: permease [Spirochaetota bacterium]
MPDAALYFGGLFAVMSALFVTATLLAALVRSEGSAAWVSRTLRGHPGLRGNLIATAIGLVTPFCSCTTVPIFAGLLASDVNLGVAVSFLIASPTMNIAAFVLLLSLFGTKAALFYLGSCAAAAVLLGLVFGRLRLRDHVNPAFAALIDGCQVTWKEALRISAKTFTHFLPVLALSAAAGAAIHNWLPPQFVAALSGDNSILAVPVATALGALVYADVIVILPIGYALLEKGLNQGIVFAFMISAAGISLPSVLLLAKILSRRLLLLLVGLLLAFYMGLGMLYFHLP